MDTPLIEGIKLLIQGLGLTFLIILAYQAGKVQNRLGQIEVELKNGNIEFHEINQKIQTLSVDVATIKAKANL